MHGERAILDKILTIGLVGNRNRRAARCALGHNAHVFALQRFLMPLSLVAAVTVVALATGIPTSSAALLLLGAVVAAALLGRVAGLVAATTSGVALHVWFSPGVDLWDLTDRDELIALATYVTVALVVGTLVARLSELRRRAELGEREARIRLDLQRRLLAGETPAAVVRSAAAALTGLFGLASCRLHIGDLDVSVDGGGRKGRTVRITIGTAEVEAVLPVGHPVMSEADRAVIEALAAGLAASVDLVRVGAEAKRVKTLAETSQMRARVLSAVSHNMRTPLSAIRASAELLENPDSGLDGPARAELLTTVREETLRLERFVANTLDLGRLRAGGLVPDRHPVDIADIVRAAVRRLDILAGEERIVVVTEEGLPELFLDTTMMEQVLGNLLENALRFAPAGTVVTVAARKAGNAVELRVVDHGPGIAPVDRARVFEEFARGAGQRDEGPGVGLGLAIVRSMVQVHGGGVWYEETRGGGATFAISLPVEVTV